MNTRIDEYTQALSEVKKEQEERRRPLTQQQLLKQRLDCDIKEEGNSDPQYAIDIYLSHKVSLHELPTHIKNKVHIKSDTEGTVLPW